jgi:proline iminopeptidase
MPSVYPPVEPYETGMLDVGDGQRLYWEQCGLPNGKPALVLHGGPGSGGTADTRRLFDPARYRVVLFDQRGCGRSTPHASEPVTDLAANTTAHLLADIERLRSHLGIGRWLVFGSSWGSTLALAYAETHPAQVGELVLSHVTTSRPADIHWLYHGVGRHFPEAWARFRAGARTDDPQADLVEAYANLLADPDPAVCARAAQDWCDWEAAVVSTDPEHTPHPRYRDPRFRMAFARIVTHYFRNRAFLEDGQLLRDAHRLAGIRGALIHGRRDLGTPLSTVEQLAQVWPDADLAVIEEAGHEVRTPGMIEAIVAAIDRFARS